jgi:single-strand DNA-binding protein
MNSITIAGNISQDAEVRYLPEGASASVTSFSVADNMYGKDKGAIFWRCAFFGARGEAVSAYLLKGQAVTVTGNVAEREWTDKDGVIRKSMDVRVNDLALQGGRKEAQTPAARPVQARPAAPTAKPVPAGSGFDDMDDDIPF